MLIVGHNIYNDFGFRKMNCWQLRMVARILKMWQTRGLMSRAIKSLVLMRSTKNFEMSSFKRFVSLVFLGKGRRVRREGGACELLYGKSDRFLLLSASKDLNGENRRKLMTLC